MNRRAVGAQWQLVFGWSVFFVFLISNATPEECDKPHSPTSISSIKKLDDAVSAVSRLKIECKEGHEVVAAKIATQGIEYPESPIQVGDRTYFVEYSKHQVSLLEGNRAVPFWSKPGCGPASVTRHEKGFLVACYDSNQVVKLNEEGKEEKTFGPFKGPNDFTSDGQGGHYFTASGVFSREAPVEGEVYHLSANGEVKKVASDIHYSNGIIYDPKKKHILVCEHLKNRLLKFPVQANGNLGSQPQVFADLAALAPPHSDLSGGLQGPDGMRQAPDGTIFVAQYAGSRVLKLSQNGDWIGQIEFESSFPNTTNVWIQGNTLYVTAAEESHSTPRGILIEVTDPKLTTRKSLKCKIS